MDSADASDIAASLRGDGDAYARIVRRYQQAIAGYLWRFTRHRGTCEELVQEVFVQAYFGLAGYRGDAPLEHWLRRIATRVGYRYWKERRRMPHANASLRAVREQRSPAKPAEAGEIVHKLLAQLPPRDRLVLTLMYLERKSVEEIAELIGWSRTMVKVQAHRARAKLRKLAQGMESQS